MYAQRDDVNAVVHAHPPAATAIACGGSRVLEQPFIAEAVVSLGPAIPTAPYAPPGAAAAAALAPLIRDHDAVLLANHGVMAWGAEPELALLRLELVEHLARIALAAQPLGGVRPLPAASLPGLLEARARAGLGATADRAAADRAAADRAAAHRAAAGRATAPVDGTEPAPGSLEGRVRAELARVLGHRR